MSPRAWAWSIPIALVLWAVAFFAGYGIVSLLEEVPEWIARQRF